MINTQTAALIYFALILCNSAHAESLRCEGGIVTEGDSRLSVIYKCGQPKLVDSLCSPVYFSSTNRLVPEPFASAYVPCQPVDQLFYERGAGNLNATVHIRAGKVQSILYGPAPK